MPLNLDRGFRRVTVLIALLSFAVVALLSISAFSQRRDEWTWATKQPSGPPVVLLGSTFGFLRLPPKTPANEVEALTRSIVATMQTLPTKGQVLTWEEGCVWREEQPPAMSNLMRDLNELLGPPDGKKACRLEGPPSTSQLSRYPFIAGYVLDRTAFYSLHQVFAAESAGQLSNRTVSSLRRARYYGALPGPIAPISPFEVLARVGIPLLAGIAPLAIFYIVRWIAQGFTSPR